MGRERRNITIKIILINPNTRYMGGLFTVHPPMGLLYISSVLLKNKHDVSIIDADIDDFSLDDIRDKITLERPQIVGITMNTFQTKSAFETAYTIKSTDPNITVVVGGPHPTIIGKQILDDCESIDIAVIGEGEHTMLEVANTIENSESLSDVCGICYRDENEIKTTSPRDFITDLDTLPFPSVELVQPIDKYPGPHPTGAKPTVQIMASRGCPFKCTFCSNPVWGNTVRFRSPENILTEIESLHEKYGVKEIFFQDDTF
ncbi:MAG: cobalamin-dependent protein, partial [Desulfobacterales bacterium]|nr:cobalamin-dependent protein [Desulfobacterales bacterium]